MYENNYIILINNNNDNLININNDTFFRSKFIYFFIEMLIKLFSHKVACNVSTTYVGVLLINIHYFYYLFRYKKILTDNFFKWNL